MTEDGSKRQILGYVSAYLKQPLRSLAEAEQDTRAERSENESPGMQAGPAGEGPAVKAPRS